MKDFNKKGGYASVSALFREQIRLQEYRERESLFTRVSRNFTFK